MCGHATLATAGLLLSKLEPERAEVSFETRSGRLIVRRHSEDPGRLTLDFPPWPCVQPAVEAPPALVAALGGRTQPVECFPVPELHGAPYYLFRYESEAEILNLAPNFPEMEANVVATAPSEIEGVDFCSRWFGPRSGIDEDPVTGSAHMTLAPFWSAKLGKTTMEARQLSSRGGELHVELKDDRVLISGATAFYMEGKIQVPTSA